MKKGIIWLVVIIVVVFGVSYFVRSGNSTVAPADNSSGAAPVDIVENPSPVPPPTVTNGTNVNLPPAPPHVIIMPTVAPVKEFTVTGSNFDFAPKTLTVNKGDTVKITFKNSAGTHDLKIDEFSVATKKLNGGQEETVTFTADKAGTFEYYCSVGSHRAMGMWGTLTVK